MADNLTKEQRTKCMSRIRSKWTIQERKLHNFLKGNKIRHKMHPKLTGNPDILLTSTKTVVFLQGCFWHKCPKCYKEPKTRKKYWLPKIQNNVKRDRKNAKILKKEGFNVLKMWEHQVKNELDKVITKLNKND
jgi:DNA mismatch endonuclease (patch repair protein)|tara:strand:- start:3538 stop:3936 length:399 start_codon:yes stop_codon:yes gene_type:complete